MRSELKPRLQRKNRLHKGCKLFVLALLLGNIGFAYAESDASTMKLVEESRQTTKGGVVKGIVRDANDQTPLIGANIAVMVDDQILTGVITDIDGLFELNVPEGAVLKLSFVGYKEQVLKPVYGKSMEIEMESDASAMEEVVVNGFFTRQKSTFTGAAKTYTSENILKASPTNILQALSTLDPSLNIAQNNAVGSDPNNIPDLVIRSTTSLATGNEVGLNAPLIVIDGVECSLEDLYNIDMHDIERVDILKDASATALYGENAANGVIIIERKRVTQSPVRIRYTFTPEFNFADLSSYDLCNAAQKLELERLAGLYDSNSGSLDQSYYDKLAAVSSGTNTDWINKPVRNSFSHAHSLSVSGRGSGLDYNITGSVSLTDGVMKGDARDRYGVSAYLSYRAIDKMVLTLRLSHEQVKSVDSPYGTFSEYCEANPYESPYDEFGNLRKTLSYSANNPLYEASLSSFSQSETRKQTVSLDARYNFKPNLYVTAQGTMTTSRSTSDKFVSPESNVYASTVNLSQKGSYMLGNSGSDDWSAKLIGNWIHNFDDEGTMFTLNVGGEIKHGNTYNRYLYATGFLSNELADIAYATNYPTGNKPSGSEDVTSSVGAFVAANFIYKNRYVIDGSYRLSGSSKFGENNRYAPFWSTGLGYNIHNEEFIKDLGWVNTLRLRGSYGYTGSVKFNAYQAITTYQYLADFAHYAGVGAIPMAMSNPDLTWQTTKKMNIGLTSSFFGDRLNVNLDYYRELTDDMLIDMSLPPSSGATKVKNNLGSQESNGFEFDLWGKIIRTKDWEWNLSVNGLHSTTKIKHISDALKRMNDENASSNTSASPRFQYREGESPSAIYAVRSAGIDPASGKEIFIKKDGTYTYTYDAKDQVSVGNSSPKLQGSISSQLSYKSFSLSMNFSYRFGGDIYNSTRVSKIENIDPQKNVDVRAFTERWHKPGDLVPYLNISTTGGKSYVYTDRFVERDNELWLSNLYLQYNVPDNIAKKLNAHKILLGIGTEDLFRLTSAKYERGTAYPYSRNVSLTASVTF
jgi:TonB-linked SusC/RagA family outer membrane protein